MKHHNLFIETAQGKIGDRPPFWLMRQAGRYLPEYRETRAKVGSFMRLCFSPEHAAEVTLQPIRRFDMDAAILFSDILVVPHALGQTLSFRGSEGPQLKSCDVTTLSLDEKSFDNVLAPIYGTIKMARKLLSEDKPLIGFAGAPFTVACYMIEGGSGSREFQEAKKFAYGNPEKMDGLIDLLVISTLRYLFAQVRAGVDVIQIFDSWAGLLPEPYFTHWVITPTEKIIAAMKREFPSLPLIAFPRGAGMNYFKYIDAVGADVIGLDTQVPLISIVPFARERKIVLQGNLDPVILLQGGQTLEKTIDGLLEATKDIPFIFNLGHGVIKETPPENVAFLAKKIKEYRRG